MPQICRRLGPSFGRRLHLRGSPQATEKGFSPNLWTLPPRYGGKCWSLSGAYWSPPPAISNSFRSGGGNKSGISERFTHILAVRISGTMEPGRWATTGDQVIARRFVMLRGDHSPAGALSDCRGDPCPAVPAHVSRGHRRRAFGVAHADAATPSPCPAATAGARLKAGQLLNPTLALPTPRPRNSG